MSANSYFNRVYKFRFIDQPGGWFGGTVTLDWPIVSNIQLDPYERAQMP